MNYYYYKKMVTLDNKKKTEIWKLKHDIWENPFIEYWLTMFKSKWEIADVIMMMKPITIITKELIKEIIMV